MVRILPTAPFEYKMVQGIDFYEFVAAYAKTFNTVHWREGNIKSIESISTKEALITWEGGTAIGSIIFSSIPPQAATQHVQPNLWQHFKGIVVEMEASVFDDTIARLMDFNVPQMEATGFMYLLPLSTTKALVEYTLFSPSKLTEAEYDAVLNTYMEQHYKGISYKVTHTEMGAIPMTTKKFATNSSSVISIGTMGDAVKASTGYAFQFIQEQAKQIVQHLKQNQPIHSKVHHTRHHFYDAVLLYILEHNKMAGAEIFARIFKKNKAATVFKFLSNTSNLVEDISIMRSLPTSIFLPAALKVLFRRS
jgi:lycopene beta-cyclase